MKTITKILITSLILIVLFNFYLIGSTYSILKNVDLKQDETVKEDIKTLDNTEEFYSLEGYTEIKVNIEPQTIILSTNCSKMKLPLNDLQVYSIKNALEHKIDVRPTTHDSFKAVIDEYNITLQLVKITYMKNDLFLSEMIFKKDNKVLNLDAKPSDAIALALRTGNKIYMKKSILEKSGNYTC